MAQVMRRLKHWFFSMDSFNRRIARIAGGIVILMAGLVLLGWVLAALSLKPMLIGGSNLGGNAVLGLLLAGSSLNLLARVHPSLHYIRLARGCILLTGTIALLTLLQYAFRWNFGLDQFLLRNPFSDPPTPGPGDTGIPAAINLGLISLALWLLSDPEPHRRAYRPTPLKRTTNLRRHRSAALAQVLATIVGLMSLQALVAHAYGLPYVSWFAAPITAIGAPIALAFVVLSVGILALQSDRGWMQTVTSEAIGGMIARRFLPLAILMPFMLGWLILRGYQANLYDATFALSLLTISLVTGGLGIVLQKAREIDRTEQERQQAEQERGYHQDLMALQLAEIEAIYHTAPIGLAVLDWNLRFVRLNQRLAEINGQPIEAHLGRTVSEIVPALAAEVEPLLCQVLETGKPLLNLEIHGETAAQPGVQRTWIENWYPLHNSEGQVIGINIVVQEITERKQAEVALWQANQQILTIWESMSDAYATLDLEWRIVYANSTSKRLMGQLTHREPEEILGRVYWEVFPWTIGQPLEREYRRAIAEQVPVQVEVFYEPVDIWLEVRAYPSAAGLGLYFRDITERKQAEAALRNQEQQLQQLSNSMPQFVWIANGQGRLEYVNQQWCDYSGLTLEQSRDPDGAAAHHHPDELNFILEQWDIAVATKQPFEVEGRLRAADGTYRWFLIRAVPVLDKQGQVQRWYGTSTDIHERKLAQLDEQFLLELDFRLRNLSDAAAMAWEVISSVGEYLKVDRCGWIEMDGATDLATIKQDWWQQQQDAPSMVGTYQLSDFVSPDLLNLYCQGQPAVIADVMTHPFTAPLSHRYLPQIHAFLAAPCIIHGNWVAMLTVLSETVRSWQPNEVRLLQNVVARFWSVVEQTRSIQALRESEARFRTLADNIAQFAWIADANGSIFWYNQRWFDYTGKTPEEVQGWSWLSQHHPDHRDRVVEQFQQCLKTGETWEDTFPLRGRDGQYRWFLSRAVPIRDEQDKILRWFGTNTDITSRKHLEDTLAAQTEELTRTNRLKDEFLTALSHELRTPLNPILGWTQMMRMQRLTPTQTVEALETIERNVKQQIALVNDLLDVSRVIQGKLNLKLHPIDLAAVVSRAIETVQFTAQAKHIQIRFQASSLLPVMGDSDRLQQVFWNLFSNAIKFTPEGGKVEVNLSKVTSQYSTYAAQVCVIDNGVGIPPEFLPHVFEHFRQADGGPTREYGGLGLGLSIVRHLVELHGGTVTVESAGIGQGAAFTVTLPFYAQLEAPVVESVPLFPDAPAINSPTDLAPIDLAPTDLAPTDLAPTDLLQSAVSSPAASSSATPTDPLRGIKVLLVDDDPDNLDLLCFLLQEHGATVTALTSPLEALAWISTHPPDLIVSDIGMPKMNGYEFMRQVRTLPQCEQIPALALTAFGRQEDQNRALQAGFQQYITKPIDPIELVSILVQLESTTRSMLLERFSAQNGDARNQNQTY